MKTTPLLCTLLLVGVPGIALSQSAPVKGSEDHIRAVTNRVDTQAVSYTHLTLPTILRV